MPGYRAAELNVSENIPPGTYKSGISDRYSIDLFLKKPVFIFSNIFMGMDPDTSISKAETNVTNRMEDVERQVKYWASRGLKITVKGSESFEKAVNSAIDEGRSWQKPRRPARVWITSILPYTEAFLD